MIKDSLYLPNLNLNVFTFSNIQIYLQVQRSATIKDVEKCITYFEGNFKIYK